MCFLPGFELSYAAGKNIEPANWKHTVVCMFGVFINFPMHGILSLHTFPEQILMSWAIRQVLRGENWSGVLSYEFPVYWMGPAAGPSSAGGVLPFKNHAPLHSLWLLSPPQETSFPMRKSRLLTTCQGHSEQLRGNHTHFLSPLVPTVGLFLCSFIQFQGNWCKKKANETHLISVWGLVMF